MAEATRSSPGSPRRLGFAARAAPETPAPVEGAVLDPALLNSWSTRSIRRTLAARSRLALCSYVSICSSMSDKGASASEARRRSA